MSEQEIGNLLILAAAKGADFLDGKKPYWFTEINLESLRMDDAQKCIIGQLYGSYLPGLRAIELRLFEDTSIYGFCGSWACWAWRISMDEQRDLLTDAWKKEIRDRLGVRAYYIWLNNGRQGSQDENWYMAKNAPAHQSVNPFFDTGVA